MKRGVQSLRETLLAPDKRSRVVQDTVRLVEQEVSAKGGLSGVAIKAGYKAVSNLKPTLIQEAVDGLIDLFVEHLEPFFADWRDNPAGKTFGQALSSRAGEVANALLAVTDQRADHAQHATLKKVYQKLRPYGEKNVVAAVPGLGSMMDKHITS
jgi:hypothetical protein